MKALDQPIRVGEIVDALGGELRGDPDTPLNQLASLEQAQSGSISFIAGAQYKAALAATKASVVIMVAEYADLHDGPVIIAADPYLYFARLTQWWKKHVQGLQAHLAERIAPSATIHPTAHVADTATIGAGAVIDAYARIGEHTQIGAQSYIGIHASVGHDSYIAPLVSIMNECRVGNFTRIHSGSVIGADGFGYAPENKRWVKIEQLGGVLIGDHVEIGANTCVDRGALEDTVIGDGVKLDNLIQIAHNVHVGDDTAMASCVGISGSTHIGKRCIIGGAVGMAGHLEIVDDVVVMAATNVTRSISKPGFYSGIVPFDEANAWRKNAAMFRQLSHMRDRIRALEKQVSNLTTNSTDKTHD